MSLHFLHQELLNVTRNLITTSTHGFFNSDNLVERWYDNYIVVRDLVSHRGWTINLAEFARAVPAKFLDSLYPPKQSRVMTLGRGELIPHILKWNVKEARLWYISFIKIDRKLVSMNIIKKMKWNILSDE
jgi:hypothetical protein